MKILITGGAGYIGSFMTKRLLDANYEATVIDSLEKGHRKAIDKRAKLEQGDLKNASFVQDIFCKEPFDAVIHFAGYISMEESMKNPGIYFENNFNGAVNILEAMVKNHIKNFIFSSTAGVYGNPVRTPIAEDHPKNPTNPYGESKLMVEKILSWYKKIYGLNFASLRYFNASGASLDGLMGENHNPETHIIPNAIKAAIENSEFTLFGTDYHTFDGTCIRDYIHVIDLVDAHMLAFKKLQKEGGAFFYNVGVGKGCSNKQVIDMVKKISSVDFKVKYAPRRRGDTEILIADPRKIQEELRFSPKYSDLETIVKTAWEWHKKNLKFSIRNLK